MKKIFTKKSINVNNQKISTISVQFVTEIKTQNNILFNYKQIKEK